MPDRRATIVLVHGAWHGAWCWDHLRPHLTAHSMAVAAIELPSIASVQPAGLPEDAAHLSALLSGIAGPIILCGHSYGGMVISAADTAGADVRHLVYLCAYLTRAGESLEGSLREAGERRPGHWIRRLPDGRTCVDAGRARERFYQDCCGETQDWAVQRLRPHWARVLSQATPTPAWQRHPSTYVVCSEDAALDPRVQREVYGARAARTVTLQSGHSPFLSQPEQLARVLVCDCQ